MMATAAAFRFPLTTAHRMIDRVHYHAPHVRSASLPPRATSFSAGNVHMIYISNLTDGGETVLVDPTDFAGRHFYQRVTTFEVIQDRLLTCAASNLTTAAGTQFNVVNVCSQRNCAERQRITEIRRNIMAGDYLGADLEPVRRQDVVPFPITVLNKSNARRPVGVIFDSEDFRGHAMFAPFEINFPVMLFMPAPNVTRGQPAVIVPAAALFLGLQ